MRQVTSRKAGTPMNDLISRQAAVDALRGMRLSGDQSDDEKGAFQLALTLVVGILREVPSAQLEGEWLNRSVCDDPKAKVIEQWQSAKCSVCGKYHTTPYLYYFDCFDWCPNCGARMKKRGEET